MTLYGTPASPPTEAEAAGHLQAFVGRLGPRLAFFRDEVRAAGGPAVDARVDALDELVDHVVGLLRDPAPVDEPPDWFVGEYRELGWSEFGAALVEGLIAHVAQLMTAATGARWELDTDKRSAYFRQPVLSNRMAPPWQLVLSAVRKADRGRPDHRLARFVQASIDTAAPQAPGARAVAAPQLDVLVTPVRHPEFDVQASIPEWAEDSLGRVVFDTLVDRFRAVDGIQDAVHEDREVFLLRTTGVEPGVLQERLQRVLDAAGGTMSR
jgi:hypothetical protein